MLSQDWEQLLLTSSDDRIVLSLVHAWLHKTFLLAYLDELLDLGRRVIREAERLELACSIRLVQRFSSLRKRSYTVWKCRYSMLIAGVFNNSTELSTLSKIFAATWLPGTNNTTFVSIVNLFPAATVPSLSSDVPGAWGG